LLIPEDVVFDVTFTGFNVKPLAVNEAAGANECAKAGGKVYIMGRTDYLGVASSINAANGVISASIYGTSTALANAELYPSLVRLEFVISASLHPGLQHALCSSVGCTWHTHITCIDP
jgi:hypothetical protein